MNKYGADVLRLWTASCGIHRRYCVSAIHCLNQWEAFYRNLRYRLRMLLGLIDDLQPEHLVAREELEPIDRLALAKLDELARTVVTAYKEYRLHE